eukprot:scpid81413/ scgid7092/ 
MSGTVQVVTVTEEVRPPASFTCRIVFAIVGSFVGYSVAVCLGVAFKNPTTGAFAGLSGILATICLILHWKASNTVHGRPRRLEHPGRLVVLSVVGATFVIIGIGTFITFIAVAAYQKQGLHPDHDGYYLTSIWCAMTTKWAALLLFYSRQYKRIFFAGYRPENESLINH